MIQSHPWERVGEWAQLIPSPLEIEHKRLDSVVEGTPVVITMGKPEKEAVVKEKN